MRAASRRSTAGMAHIVTLLERDPAIRRHAGSWPGDLVRPLAAGPVHGVVAVPGSKSVTNRALLLAALSGGPASVSGAPASRDTALMVGALRALGVPIEVDGERVAVGAHDGLRGGGTVDCGLAGTRHAVRAARRGARRRPRRVRRRRPRPRTPLTTVLDALRALGARVDGDGAAVHPARHRRARPAATW